MGSTVENQKRLLKTKPKVSRKTEGPEVPFEDDLSPPRASSMYSPEDWGAIPGTFAPGYNLGFKASAAAPHPVTFADQTGATSFGAYAHGGSVSNKKRNKGGIVRKTRVF